MGGDGRVNFVTFKWKRTAIFLSTNIEFLLMGELEGERNTFTDGFSSFA